MFGLFARAPRQARPSRPSFRPRLERLEERDCPTSLSLSAMVSSTTKVVTFYGSVSNTLNVSGITVQLSGVANGSATTDANGSFTVQLTASGLGTESATALDASASTTLTDPNAPLISSFTNTEMAGGYYVFSGHVNGVVFQGEVITFGGQIPSMTGQTATVNSDGSFSFVGHLATGESGAVTATATADVWGINNTATTTVDQLH